MTSNVETARGTYEKMATEWYYQIMNDVIGPLTSRQLVDRVRSGQVKEDTLVRKDDSQWVPARQVNGLLEAVTQNQSQRICPYCGTIVDNPPTTCRGCNRKLVLSFSSRLTTLGKGKTKAIKVERDREADAKAIRERSDRADIVRYLVLLIVWLGVLLAAPFLIYLATSGRFFFEGDLAVIAMVVVSVIVGGIYYFISRVA